MEAEKTAYGSQRKAERCGKEEGMGKRKGGRAGIKY
jgi:hypothetical protein